MFTLGKDSVNDGLLKAWEIYNMQLNTALVVLSACNTGYGKLHRGEGMISLSRGFFIAGAKSVITTLWPVPDGNSSRLMNYFYTNLSAKENIADALYHAKLTYLRESDDMDAYPSLWAGYIVLGNGSIAFEPSHSKSKYFYYIGLCLLISMIIIIIFRKKIRVTRENKLISF
jgi:CHAT domain-containing protein